MLLPTGELCRIPWTWWLERSWGAPRGPIRQWCCASDRNSKIVCGRRCSPADAPCLGRTGRCWCCLLCPQGSTRRSPPPRGGRAAASDAVWDSTRGGHLPCRLPGMPHQGSCHCCSRIAPRLEGSPGRSAARWCQGLKGKGRSRGVRFFRRCSKRAGCSGSWVPNVTTCTRAPKPLS